MPDVEQEVSTSPLPYSPKQTHVANRHPIRAPMTNTFEQVPGVPLAPIDPDGLIGASSYLALDPIDGTTNFACGGPDWGVSHLKVAR